MKKSKTYWKSLAELNRDPLVDKLKQNEFIEEIPVDEFLQDDHLSSNNTSRRDFLKFLGFSTAAATLAACEAPVNKVIPYVIKPEEIIPEMEVDLQRLEQIGRRFSKMGSKSDFEELDLSERVEKIVNYLTKRLPSIGKKVKLVNDIQPGIFIRANGSLLAWSIENIIRNGIDAIEREDGMISISLKKDVDGIKIRIEDNGKGIPKKDWKNIFRPGFSTKQTGWGLGLSLSSRIVEEIHGGSLKVISSSFDTGTIIEISL